MNGPDLPPDLAEIDQDLGATAVIVPPPALRRRVLTAVGRELRRPAWSFGAGTAAAALLWACLSLSVTNDTGWRLGDGLDGGRVTQTANRLRALAPDLPADEAYRLALLAQARSRLTPAPALPSAPGPLLRFED